MMATKQAFITFESEGLALEGVLELPGVPHPVPGVVVCHPHSLYGGDMENNIVMGICNALLARDIAVLRFNFRGVGESQGSFSYGVGEATDAAEAVSLLTLAEGVDAGRMGIAGYSFGAGVALGVAAQGGLVQAVALVSCPDTSLNHHGAHSLVTPKLLVSGDRDHVTDPRLFTFLTGRFLAPKEVHLLEGADHFLRGYEEEACSLVADFFVRWLRRDQD